MNKKQIEAEIKAKKEAIKQANRELSRLQDELKKKDEPIYYKACVNSAMRYNGCKNYSISLNIETNDIFDCEKIKSAIESLSDPVDPKSYVDWDKIPNGYNWVAMDKNGDTFAYKAKPPISECQWLASDITWCLQNDLFHGDWRDSLIHRPGVKE